LRVEKMGSGYGKWVLMGKYILKEEGFSLYLVIL
jgi:hypothetical protein